MLGVTQATVSRDLDDTNVSTPHQKPTETRVNGAADDTNVSSATKAEPAPKPEPIKAPEPKVPLSPEAEAGLNVIADIVRGKTDIGEVAPPQSRHRSSEKPPRGAAVFPLARGEASRCGKPLTSALQSGAGRPEAARRYL